MLNLNSNLANNRDKLEEKHQEVEDEQQAGSQKHQNAGDEASGQEEDVENHFLEKTL